jgi:hypothetical protein
VQLPRTEEKMPRVCIPEHESTIAAPTDNLFAIRRYCDSGSTTLVKPMAFFLLRSQVPNNDGAVIGGAHNTFVVWERGNTPHPPDMALEGLSVEA